jgi:phosphocarrier protein HPr
MIRKEYTIVDKHGMHARPAASLLKLARLFGSEINIIKGSKTVQPKSMLNILAMALKYEDEIVVEINGSDEDLAAGAFDRFFIEDMKRF